MFELFLISIMVVVILIYLSGLDEHREVYDERVDYDELTDGE